MSCSHTHTHTLSVNAETCTQCGKTAFELAGGAPASLQLPNRKLTWGDIRRGLKALEAAI